MKQHLNTGFNKTLDEKRFEVISKFFMGNSCLEVGSAEGFMTKKLKEKFSFTYAVEPDEESWKKLFKLADNRMIALNSRLEDLHMQYTEYPKVDTIVCCNVLEHISDPDSFLRELKEYGNKETNFIFTVPNADSYHRALGVELGKLKQVDDLGESDKKICHKRIFRITNLMETLDINGFFVKDIGTYVYKPFPNRLMHQLPKIIKDYCLNLKMVTNGAEILCICKLNQNI